MPMFTGTPVEDDAPQTSGPMFSGTLVEDPLPAVSFGSWRPDLADVSKSVGGGLSKGVAGLVGLPADVANLITLGYDKGQARLTGVPYEQVRAQNEAKAPIKADTIAQYGGDALNKSYGFDYQPQTTAGHYAETVASFAPAALAGPGSLMRRFVVGAGIPGLASEAAGQATAGTAAEPYARVAAALAAPGIASRAITPIGTAPGRAALVDTLDREGIPITAGQRTGSTPLQYMEGALGEAPGGGGGAARAMDAQRAGLNRAVARRFGEDADNLGPEVMQRATDRIGGVFEDVSSRRPLTYDAEMGRDLRDAMDRYGTLLDPLQRPVFERLHQNIQDRIIQGGGQIPGETYQTNRSALSRLSSGAAQRGDTAASDAYGGLRDALDGAFERSVAGTPDAGRLAEARQQWGALKMAERAMNVPGAAAAEGNISPAALRSTVARRDPAAYARGEGDMAELARAAPVLAPLPNSGTGPRSLATSMVTGLGTASAAALGGAPLSGSVAAAFGGAVAPAIAGRVLMSRPAQAYLANGLLAPVEGGLSAGAGRAIQAYRDAEADPLMLRVKPRARP